MVARPSSLSAALEFRAEHRALPFAGGTDLMVRRRGYSGTGTRFSEAVLLLDNVRELKTLEIEENVLEIGAGVTLAELLDFSRLPELLRRGVELIAAPALRNRATLAGNICNASPAADSLPPLYVHEAELVLRSISGERRMGLMEFITGPGATVLKQNELLTAIHIPLLPAGRVYYRKVGTRRANALSKLSAAGFVRLKEGVVRDFRFALGAVAPRVVRLTEAENLITGKSSPRLDCESVLAAAAPRVCPIDDQRSTADYRRQVALNCLKEFLDQIEE